MRSVFLAGWVLAAVGTFACGERCLIYVLTPLTVTFLNTSGAPLSPASVTIGESVWACDAGARCADGALVIPDLPQPGALTLRAEATTGETFAGTVTPSTQVVGETCAGPATSRSVSLTLSPK